MSAYPGQGRPSNNVRLGTHGRVEQARQALVNAEESYLRAHNWSLNLVGKDWLWQAEVGGVHLVMTRVEAVRFQHASEAKP